MSLEEYAESAATGSHWVAESQFDGWQRKMMDEQISSWLG
jgi:hypothetical protein